MENEKFIESYILFGLYNLQTLENHFSSVSIRLFAMEFTASWNKIMTFFFIAEIWW